MSEQPVVQSPPTQRSGSTDGFTYSNAPVSSHLKIRNCSLLRVSANRFTYSKQYIAFYVLLTLLSVATVGISFAAPKGCPHWSFFVLEIIVLLALIAEVVIRIISLGRHYWKSWWNIADAILMGLCIMTFCLVFAGCSNSVRRERQSSTVLLVIRNLIQVVRLVNLLWHNRNNFNNKQVDIDLEDVEDLGFKLLPGEEDAELADDEFEISDDDHELRI